tara:strand:- start:108 stop:467 length:360 start_codon:yes stop_codon:yes gene_type:complete
MSENPHFLEKEIHGTSVWDAAVAENFENQIGSLGAQYPINDSQNYHMFVRLIREFNRKLNKFELSERIFNPIDAGFRPLDVEGYFGDLTTSGLSDFLENEDGSNLLQENGFKLILEQDI